jgi:hypothetical protein
MPRKSETPTRNKFEIEPRIQPLVDELNATGLLTTFSSCEGHYSRSTRANPYQQTAHIAAKLVKGRKEKELLPLFFRIWRDNINLGVGDAGDLTIAKRYVLLPFDEDVADLQFDFWIEVRPFDLRATDTEKRMQVDSVLATLVGSVKAFRR